MYDDGRATYLRDCDVRFSHLRFSMYNTSLGGKKKKKKFM